MKVLSLYFINIFIKFFFLLTPFFALSMFLSMTTDYKEKEKKKLALRITLSASIVCLIIFLFGNHIFYIFGITIDAFRIGSGGLLFLTAIKLSQGKNSDINIDHNDDIVVVPLSIPIIVGPATIGTLLIMSTEITGFEQKILSLIALFTAILCVGVILFLSASFEKILKKKGINILSKITGLILSALASQIIFAGIKSFFK
ncbi:MAG: NAAT family transporter [Desulfobacterales bacterium]|nr:NAAT family transporter [Desulfobacterales bacterium]MBF0396854.1 NAAT family transporter [Desulfobacterales bacterium]